MQPYTRKLIMIINIWKSLQMQLHISDALLLLEVQTAYSVALSIRLYSIIGPKMCQVFSNF